MATFTRAAKNAQLDEHNAKVLAQMSRETGEALVDPTAPRILSRIGDEIQLRGIPAIGRGVAGAMRFTKPGDGIR